MPSDGKYFQTSKRGEIHELKEELHIQDKGRKKEAVKKVPRVAGSWGLCPCSLWTSGQVCCSNSTLLDVNNRRDASSPDRLLPRSCDTAVPPSVLPAGTPGASERGASELASRGRVTRCTHDGK